MIRQFFIGIDGGATKCVVRLEDEQGALIGYQTSGPANIRLSPTQAWASIQNALTHILKTAAIDPRNHHFHAGIGLAGCEVPEAYQAFINTTHPFRSMAVVSDAEVACLGAHAGADGAIIIAGTGVVGFQTDAHHATKISGWGFPQDDQGGGAWLGLEAMKITLQWLDKRLPVSSLAEAIYAHFNHNASQLVTWANAANSTAFAQLAPIVIQQSAQGDVVAQQLLQQAAEAIDRVGAALVDQQQSVSPLPCVLLGGVAPYLEPYLGNALRARLRTCQLTPDAGAILLARQHAKDVS